MATAKSIVDAPDHDHTSRSKRRRVEVSPNATCMQALPYDLLLRILEQVCPASIQPRMRYGGKVKELGRFVRVSKLFSWLGLGNPNPNPNPNQVHAATDILAPRRFDQLEPGLRLSGEAEATYA